MIESNTVVLEDLNLKFVVVLIVSVFIPDVFRTLKYLVFVR